MFGNINLKTQISTKTNNTTVARVMGRSKLSCFLNLAEREFQKYMREIEKDPLFCRLAYPDNGEEKVIRFKKFTSSSYYLNICEFNEDISVDCSSLDIEGILKNNHKIIPVIRSLGIENFKKYFLYNESNMGINEIAEICGLSNKDTRKIMDLINDVFIREEFFSNKQVEQEGLVNYWKVADIENQNGEFIIKYLTINSARGRYLIDYKRLFALKEKGKFKTGEVAKINSLISRLKLINMRKTLVYRIIQILLEKQEKYFESGFEEDLSCFNQRDAARILEVTPGIICRTISCKCIGLPSGVEKPLKDLFVNAKRKNKELVRKVIDENGCSSDRKRIFSDTVIKKILLEKYGISLSRRTICQYRREMLINNDHYIRH